MDKSILIPIWSTITLSLIIGIIFGKVTKSAFWDDIFSKIFKRNIYRSVWHETYEKFLNSGNQSVEIKIKGIEQRFIGQVGKATDYGDSKELYLVNVHKIVKDNPFEYQKLCSDGMLVKFDSLDYIIFTPGKGNSE